MVSDGRGRRHRHRRRLGLGFQRSTGECVIRGENLYVMPDRTVQDLPARYNDLDELARFRYRAWVWVEAEWVGLHGPVLDEALRITCLGF